jgi:hypothetical protein
MAITLDNAPPTRWLSGGVPTLTYSFTRAAGPGVLIVGVGRTTATGVALTGVTYDGEALTLVDDQSVGTVRYAMYRLNNPASSGARDIVVTSPSAETVIISNAVSFSGSPSLAAFNTNAETATSVNSLDNALTVGDQSWIAIVGGSQNVDLAAGTNVTNNSTSNPLIGWFGPRSGAGSTTLTVPSTADNIVTITVEVAPAVAGSPWYYFSQQ